MKVLLPALLSSPVVGWAAWFYFKRKVLAALPDATPMSGAWVPDPADLANEAPYADASPSIGTLPLPEDPEELAAIAQREQDRKARGLGFAPNPTPPHPDQGGGSRAQREDRDEHPHS